MKNWKYILLSVILFPLVGMVSSCSEESTEEDEYGNWQERNEEMTDVWASQALNGWYKKIKCYTKDHASEGANSDYIYVEELADTPEMNPECKPEARDGSPMATDNVWVAYRARLIPTTSYPEGEIIDQSFVGDFSWRTADAIGSSGFIPGFTTALIHMHVGDHWRVYIPYQLAYGSNSSSPPAYSNMIFEIALFDFWNPDDENHPTEFKARAK
jgi:FKBP-type peptidyl-prolyl cis-trans isomerase FklB